MTESAPWYCVFDNILGKDNLMKNSMRTVVLSVSLLLVPSAVYPTPTPEQASNLVLEAMPWFFGGALGSLFFANRSYALDKVVDDLEILRARLLEDLAVTTDDFVRASRLEEVKAIDSRIDAYKGGQWLTNTALVGAFLCASVSFLRLNYKLYVE
jgi:hypothetical protein